MSVVGTIDGSDVKLSCAKHQNKDGDTILAIYCNSVLMFSFSPREVYQKICDGVLVAGAEFCPLDGTLKEMNQFGPLENTVLTSMHKGNTLLFTCKMRPDFRIEVDLSDFSQA